MTTQLPLDLSAAHDRKRRGIDAVEGNNETFVSTLRRLAREHAEVHGGVTADDVRRFAAELGLTPTHRNAWGAIFRGPGWVKVGEAPSKLPSNHSHMNPVWAWQGRGETP